MPRIKRWHPISHDFNRDPQVIELRIKHGDWAALAWQECLSIGDRNDGVIPGSLEQIASVIARVSLQKYLKRAADQAQMVLRSASDWGWIEIKSDCIVIAKFSKYHRTEERKPAPSEPDLTELDLIKTPIVPKGDDCFDKFWEQYPKKIGKGAAEKAWKKAKINGSLQTVLDAIDSQKRGAGWQKDNGQYIPNPATWINQKRWLDEESEIFDKPSKSLAQIEADYLARKVTSH